LQNLEVNIIIHCIITNILRRKIIDILYYIVRLLTCYIAMLLRGDILMLLQLCNNIATILCNLYEIPLLY